MLVAVTYRTGPYNAPCHFTWIILHCPQFLQEKSCGDRTVIVRPPCGRRRAFVTEALLANISQGRFILGKTCKNQVEKGQIKN